MIGTHRPRRLAWAALTAVLVLTAAACSQYPNTTFTPHSDLGRTVDHLWNTLLFWGTLVFVLVEALLIYIIVRFRHRDGAPPPDQHLHGHTVLEIAWTLVPALILVVIAVPTVKGIFVTQGLPPGDNTLEVQAVGHQWWWEFRYPQYTTQRADGRLDTLVTANEVYLPIGRTVRFALSTKDVIHSFWIPQLGGKRDLVPQRVNHMWLTPDDSLSPNVWNGFCAEYCGASHGNMRFRAFNVSQADFALWTAHQLGAAVFPPPAPPAPDTSAAGRRAAQLAQAAPPPPVLTPVAYEFPKDRIPAYAVPSTPIPPGAGLASGLVGDATRGSQLIVRNACVGCHTIRGTPAAGLLGPNLTHVASRTTIGAGLYPNDAEHLGAWIKNTNLMKPGSIMPPQGKDVVDPHTNAKGLLTDEQIADIVAYLQSLK